jgi:hypothetical protein
MYMELETHLRGLGMIPLHLFKKKKKKKKIVENCFLILKFVKLVHFFSYNFIKNQSLNL